MAILSQLVDAHELENLTAEELREMILKLNQEIAAAGSSGTGEEILVSIEATLVGVKSDRPAGNP